MFKYILSGLIVGTTSIASTFGIEILSDSVIQISERVDETLMIGSSEATINATVDGDLFIGAQTITINAEVTEDAWVGGHVVNINGKIADDLRVGGNVINISAPIGDDILIGGNTVQVNGTVGGDAVIGGNLVRINQQISGDAEIGAEEMSLNAVIFGDLIFEGERISIGSGGSIGGDLQIVEGVELPRNMQDYVGGAITYSQGGTGIFSDVQKQRERSRIEQPDAFSFNRFRFVSLILLGSIFILFMPNYLRKAGQGVVKNPLKTGLIGFLLLIATPFAALILMATGVGAALGGWILANYVFLWVFMGVFVVVFAADLLVENVFGEYIGRTVWAKIGVMVMLAYFITLLPYFVTILLGLFGVGAGYVSDMKIIEENR